MMERWGDWQGGQGRPLAGGDAGAEPEMMRIEGAKIKDTRWEKKKKRHHMGQTASSKLKGLREWRGQWSHKFSFLYFFGTDLLNVSYVLGGRYQAVNKVPTLVEWTFLDLSEIMVKQG